MALKAKIIANCWQKNREEKCEWSLKHQIKYNRKKETIYVF